jgi:hypothetical protein
MAKMNDDAAIDYVVSGVAITAPVWATGLTVWLNLAIAIGGLFLLGIRIRKALKD